MKLLPFLLTAVLTLSACGDEEFRAILTADFDSEPARNVPTGGGVGGGVPTLEYVFVGDPAGDGLDFDAIGQRDPVGGLRFASQELVLNSAFGNAARLVFIPAPLDAPATSFAYIWKGRIDAAASPGNDGAQVTVALAFEGANPEGERQILVDFEADDARADIYDVSVRRRLADGTLVSGPLGRVPRGQDHLVVIGINTIDEDVTITLSGAGQNDVFEPRPLVLPMPGAQRQAPTVFVSVFETQNVSNVQYAFDNMSFSARP